MESVGGLFLLAIMAIAAALAVLGVLMPFFVYRIYQETCDINRKITNAISAAGGSESPRITCIQCGQTILTNGKRIGDKVRCGICGTRMELAPDA